MVELPSVATDEQIAVQIQEGASEHFGILMERYDKKLMRYGRKFLVNKENIEEIVQDIFVSTYQNINSFDPSLKFSSWIYRIAHNAFVNGLKKQQKSPFLNFDFDTLISHPAYEDPAQMENEYQMMKEMVEKGLEKLKPKYREVIILHYLEDFSYKEISDILEVPTGTVGIRMKRAKEALKKVYADMNITTIEHDT